MCVCMSVCLCVCVPLCVCLSAVQWPTAERKIKTELVHRDIETHRAESECHTHTHTLCEPEL